MADSNELGKLGPDEITKVIEAAKEEVKKEIEAANTDREKRSLGEKIREELEKTKLAAAEAVSDEVEARMGGREPHKKEEGKKVLRALTKAVEAVRQGVDPSYISKTKEGAVVLQKIAEEKIDFTPSTASAIEYYFGDYLFGDKKLIDSLGQITSDLEAKFSELREINPIAAEKIAEAIKKAAGEGGIAGLTPEEVERKLKVEKTGHFRKEDKHHYITVEEEDEWSLLFKRIGDLINKNIDQLTENERKAVFLFQWGGSLGATPEEKKAFGKAINKLGIGKNEIDRYLFLRQKFTNLPLELIKNYAGVYRNILERAEKDFNVKNLIQMFVDETGKINTSDTHARKKLKELITKYYFKVLQEIHSNKTADFHHAMQENQSYSYFFSGLSQIIFQACDELERSFPEKAVEDKHKRRDFIFFLTDTKTRFQSSIMTYANIMHNLPLWARGGPGTFEKWSQFMGNLFHSELAEVFDDDGFMDMARRVVTTVIRREIAKNGNQYPSDLISGRYDQEGVRWSQNFESLIREELEKVAEAIGINLEEDGWKIERALVYSPAIGIDTLIDIETMATADPKWADFKGIHPLLQVISAKFNWGLGRGDIYSTQIARYLLGMEINLFPKKEGIARFWRKKKWVPKEFADLIDREVRRYGDEVMGQLFSAGGLYQELLNMLTIAPSLISRHGWRMQGIYDEFSGFDMVKKIRGDVEVGDFWKKDSVWTQENWQRLWDEAIKQYGTASLWWFLTAGPSRLSQEMKRLVAKQKGEEEVNVNFIEYQPGVYLPTNKMLEEVFTFRVGDEVRKMSLLEIRQIRMNQLRGELFFRYLRRDPGNFFLILTQMAPQIAARSNELFDNVIAKIQGAKTRQAVVQAIENLKEIDRVKKEKLLAEFNNLYSKWGDFVFKLGEIRSFLLKQVEKEQKKDPKKEEIHFKDIKGFIDFLVTQSNTALEKTIKKGEIFVSEDDFTDDAVKRFIFGDKSGKSDEEKIGLIGLTTGASQDKLDDFYQNFGDFDNFGKDNFFYRMANAWFIKEFDINPFSADVNHYAVFKHIGKGGEDLFTRLHGDTLTVFQKCIKELATLNDLLLDVANTGNMEKIYALHKSVYDALSGTMGQEYAQRANYILAQIVSKFFLEHSLARDPKLNLVFPLSLIVRLDLGKKISLSKIATDNLHAYTMDTNAVRTYFMKLHELRVIPADGAWSKEHIERVFDATKEQFFVGDFVPKFLWFFVLFLLFSYIRKALEEAEGKKK